MLNPETGSGGLGGDVSLTKNSQLSIEDLSGVCVSLCARVCGHCTFLSKHCCFVWRSGEDPETRRLRTVKNIADLRQNLEETMSSLRGTQVTHRYVPRLHFMDIWSYIE